MMPASIMRILMQDLRYAVRTLRRSAGLTTVIVASLAIGIGANTAIFSVVNALLLKPLPYPDPERLAVLWLRFPGINIPQDWPSPGQYVDIQNENRSFDGMSISRGRVGTLMGLAEAQRVEALETSSSLFPLLGARALYGRLLRTEEDSPGQPPVVLLSHGFWKRAFGGDRSVVGKTITLNGLASGGGDVKNQYEVVGVLGPEFLLNEEIMPTVASIKQMDLFLPLPLGADAVKRRGDENFNVMARLKQDVTMAQAHADMAAIAARIREKDKRDRTFTIPLLAGRFFTDTDLPSTAEQVAIVDDKFAQRFWPAGDAVGKHVWFDPKRKFRIVGVVGTVKQYGLDVDGRVVVYRPFLLGSYYVARASSDPATVARDMVRKIHEFDPTITVVDIQTMTSRMSASLARQRFSTVMLGAFAGFALLLAIVGVYGVMSHLVSQGAHDIGVRMALGAERRGILLMVLRQGFALTLTGSILGLLGAAALTRVMASLLFGVGARDLVTFSTVPLLLVATAMFASYIPALRATRVDPVVALRDE